MKKTILFITISVLIMQGCSLVPTAAQFPSSIQGTWQETDYYDTFEFTSTQMTYYSFDDNEYYSFTLKSIDEVNQRFYVDDSNGDPWELNYWFDDSLLVLSWSDDSGNDITVFMEKI